MGDGNFQFNFEGDGTLRGVSPFPPLKEELKEEVPYWDSHLLFPQVLPMRLDFCNIITPYRTPGSTTQSCFIKIQSVIREPFYQGLVPTEASVCIVTSTQSRVRIQPYLPPYLSSHLCATPEYLLYQGYIRTKLPHVPFKCLVIDGLDNLTHDEYQCLLKCMRLFAPETTLVVIAENITTQVIHFCEKYLHKDSPVYVFDTSIGFDLKEYEAATNKVLEVKWASMGFRNPTLPYTDCEKDDARAYREGRRFIQKLLQETIDGTNWKRFFKHQPMSMRLAMKTWLLCAYRISEFPREIIDLICNHIMQQWYKS